MLLMTMKKLESDDDVAYTEPNPDNDVWPEHWTPAQRKYWTEYCQPVYENLETDVGRYWYRRTFRPKKQKRDGDSGVMKRDHVKFGKPEEYVAYNVSDKLDMWADLTGAIMRDMLTYSVDTDELDEAVSDIVQAKLQLLSPEERMTLCKDALSVAREYGLEIEG